MIDKVQKALEKMAPELDSYRKRRIFDKSQIEKIVENRRKYENKLQRTQKKLSDYFLYVESEKKLEKLRNSRITKTGAGLEETDLILQKNILSIYTRALHYFTDGKLVEDFYEYCARKKCYEEMKSAFATKCLKNLTDTSFWIFCAQKLWEIDDIDGARSIFMKAAGINSDLRIYVEFFRLECLYAQKVNKINEELGVDEEDEGDIEKGEIAMAVFKEMVKRPAGSEIQECLEISRMVPGLEQRLTNLLSGSTG